MSVENLSNYKYFEDVHHQINAILYKNTWLKTTEERFQEFVRSADVSANALLGPQEDNKEENQQNRANSNVDLNEVIENNENLKLIFKDLEGQKYIEFIIYQLTTEDTQNLQDESTKEIIQPMQMTI